MYLEPTCLLGRVAGFASIIGMAFTLAAAFSTGAAAAPERQLRITVYNTDLALVSDQRSVDVPDGQGLVEIVDVPSQIDPTSVHLKAVRGDLQILEQNYQYDLAGPDRILQRYLDLPVEAVLKEGDLKSGRLLSYDGGSMVLQNEEGALSLVNRAQIVDMRFPTLPEGLRTRPTLVWTLQSKGGGRMPVELSYLTGGMTWHAEYVAVANQDDTSMDLSAWVSLENRSGATFPEARLQLIAGEVHRVTPQPRMRPDRMMAMDMAMAPSKGFEEESFFEYHLYTLDRPTTLSDRETKQISLFPTATTPVVKIYEYNGQRDPRRVRVILETENRKERGLGMPLPGGKVRVYKKDSRGDLQFVGEDMIDHTPRNEKVRLGVGTAFDVVGERSELRVDRISDRVFDRTVEIKIRNRKEKEPVEVVVQESLHGDWRILESTHEHTRKDARTAEFRLDVQPDKEVVLTYKVRIRS